MSRSFRSMKLGLLGMSPIAALVLVACATSTTTNTVPTDADGGASARNDASTASGEDDGNPSSDPNGGDLGDDDSDDAPKGVKTGTIVLSQTVSVFGDQTYASAVATAYFVDAEPGAASASNCTSSTVSGCDVTECELGGAGASDGGAAKALPNAGTVTIQGGALPSKGWSLEPTGSNGAYQPATSQSLVFEAGDTLTVSATGGDVAPFADQSVSAPGDLVVSAPVFDAQSRTSIDRTKDLNVAWSGATEGKVTIDVTSTRLNERSVSLHCVVDAAGGSAKVPSAALSKLEKADGSSVYGSLSISPSSETTFSAGAYTTTFRVTATGKVGMFTASK